MSIDQVVKRDGAVASYDRGQIENAIYGAAREVGNGEGRQWAETLSWAVEGILQERFGRNGDMPHVEEVQDVVEEVLIKSGSPQIAKAYILHRQRHADARAAQEMLVDTEKLVDSYLQRADWRVNENSNMNYSLQGLNFYVASSIAARYWLHKIYPPEVQQAHIEGDLHLHDLASLSVYCCGWDLQDLLMRGFGGVPAKVQSSPPRHLRTALGQLVNFFYTLQGESAGAVAVSNFDTLLAPFIRYDGLDFSQVKQALQEYVFNINIPTRVGFQCMSEDTEILARDGWKRHDQVQPGDAIATFNVEKQEIEYLAVQRVFARPYEGEMYWLRNRISDQLLSPGHRVIRKKFNTDEYVLEEIERVVTLKSPFIVPVGSVGYLHDDGDVDEDVIRLIAWIVADGSIDKSGGGSGRISIYQSKSRHPDRFAEIVDLCQRLGLEYAERTQEGLGEPCNVIRLNAKATRRVLGYFDSDKERGIKFIPPAILALGAAASRVFLETYIKADGHDGCKITTTSEETRDQLVQVAVHAGYGTTVLVRTPDNPLSVKTRYVIRVIRHRDTYINSVEKVAYKGVIWCPNTANETVVARRNGKVFITGNTPFTNQTMDLTPSPILRDVPVVIGGEMQRETYGEFQHEMDVLNRAFAEVMLEGDAQGRVFTFPIPTYNVTRDFDWENPNLEPVWAMTSRFGIPYWANFVNSDMDPEDARSMCPLSGRTKVIVCSKQNGIRIEQIVHIVNNMQVKGTEYTVLTPTGAWVKAKPVKVPITDVYRVWFSNGAFVDMGENHLQPTMDMGTLPARELAVGMWLPFTKTSFEGELGDYDLGYAVGAYLGDGSHDNGSVVYSLCGSEKDDETKHQLERIWNSLGFFVRVTESERNVRFVRVSAGSFALLKRFVKGSRALDKGLTRLAFNGSVAFKFGVLDGYQATDGSREKKRLYTASESLRYDMSFLLSSLGRKYNISSYDDRQDRFSEHIVYRIDYPERTNYGSFYKEDDSYHYYRITKIERLEDFNAKHLYCFEVDSTERLFVLANGLVTHNCRLRLDNRELRKRIGGLFAAAPLTGSIGVVTINMSRLGYLAHDETEFLERLERLMEISRTSLEIKRNLLEMLTAQGLYPYSHHYLESVKRRFGSFWNNHFSTIGLIGMNEACRNLLGVGIAHPEGKAFAVRALTFMRGVLARFQVESDHLYNLEATPAEGASFRLARADKERFPDVITAGTDAAPYYTNSSHLPMVYSDDLFEVLEHQDDLQTLYTGGTVQHIFLGEQLDDWRQARRLVRTVAENFRLPYYTLTPTFSVCPVHGYISGEHRYCPYEHSEEELARFGRVVRE